MNFSRIKKTEIAAFIFLLIILGTTLAKKTNLAVADLGRHIKNGELLISSDSETRKKIFETNFYSYTNPDYPFINHHWGSGVIFFLIFKLGGFKALSVFFIGIYLATFIIFFLISKKRSGFWKTFIVSMIVLPLIANRDEIRPEVISYFFSGIFLWILWKYKNENLRYKYLFLLPATQLLWVNLHVYFFLGICLFGAFIFSELAQNPKGNWKNTKKILPVFLLTVFSAVINPFGIKGLLYPFNIFRNYGYTIVENQSIRFLEKINFQNQDFIVFKITAAIMLLSFVLIAVFNKKRFSLFNFILGITFSVLGFMAIRNFALFGLFALPVISHNLEGKPEFSSEMIGSFKSFLKNSLYVLIIIGVIVSAFSLFSSKGYNYGLGLMDNNNSSTDFFKKENIQGPIFNNYDIGGYLIFNLYPSQKVFVDNRPEAYPDDFFQKVYIPMQEKREEWEKQDKIYNFNAIFFSHRDYTPWGQNFLKEILNNPDWAPVFVDNYAIILLKRNEKNNSIIKEKELPKEIFKFTAN